MTHQPPPGSYPPPPGNYPPPPPGNFAPPPPGYAPAPSPLGQLPAEAYTPWISRVGAYFVDAAPIFVLMIVVGFIGGASGSADTASFLGLLAQLAVLGYVIWNFGYRQGVTGSSIGKSVLKFKVVAEATGQPIGFAMSVVRQLAHFVDGIIFCIGYLFPLWDAKRQTLADKIMSTVCLPLEPTNQPRPY